MRARAHREHQAEVLRGIVRTVFHHTERSLVARYAILSGTNWRLTPTPSGALAHAAPDNSGPAAWVLQEPNALLRFLSYRADRVGD